MPRAGQTTTGRRPRRSNRRHSFSIGDRKPPITGTPASRIARARSYMLRMTSPGHWREQNRAVRWASRMDMPMVDGDFNSSPQGFPDCPITDKYESIEGA